MSDFYEISDALKNKFEYIKYRMLLIMFDENPREYTSDWNWNLREPSWMGDVMTPAVKNYPNALEDTVVTLYELSKSAINRRFCYKKQEMFPNY